MRCLTRLAAAALAPLVLCGAAGAADVRALPPPPDVQPLFALAPRGTGDCNAGEFFESAERELRRRGAFASPRPPAALAPDDFVLTLVLRGMECRTCELSYSRRMKMPPTEQRIPASKLYSAAVGRFAEDGRRALRDGRPAEARVEFAKAVTLGRLLYEDPGITVIQDSISFGVLARGAEGLGDAALASGDAATVELCRRFLSAQQAYAEAVTRLVRGLPWASLGTSPGELRGVAALYGPSLRASVRGEILLAASIARPLVERSDREPLTAVLETAARSEPDERLRAIASWGLRLSRDKAHRLADQMSGSPWP